jgi:hypothetical protein
LSKNKFKGPQAFTIPNTVVVPQVSLSLDKNDAFVASHGIQFIHYKALPDVQGMKSRGDYRRSDQLSVDSSNGFLYKCSGEFTGVMFSNSRGKQDTEGGIIDPSQTRITLPRFYNKESLADGDRIYMVPGDKIYVKDKSINTLVGNYQRMEYEPNKENLAQFPIACVEFLVDSKGIEYFQEKDFKITSNGNIKWLSRGRNPGIDPDTGKGRVYSIRYQYEAHWYIIQILNEVRIGNVTENGVRKEARMPYQVMAVREYVYHNRNNSQETKENPKLVKEDRDRKSDSPSYDINPSTPFIKVDMSDVEE